MLLPGESHGQRSLAGYSLCSQRGVRRDGSDLARTHLCFPVSGAPGLVLSFLCEVSSSLLYSLNTRPRNGFWLRPHALLCTPPGVGGCGRWGGSSPGSASASGLRPHQHPGASLTPPTRERRVSAGGGGLGALGPPYPAGSPHTNAPPPPLLLPSGPHLAGSVGGWSDPRDGVIRGSSRVV